MYSLRHYVQSNNNLTSFLSFCCKLILDFFVTFNSLHLQFGSDTMLRQKISRNVITQSLFRYVARAYLNDINMSRGDIYDHKTCVNGNYEVNNH